MSTAAAQSRRNGVDTARLFATLDAVKAQPEAARFRFSVENRWISGTHNRNQISTFCGMGAEKQHASTFAVEADHRPVLVGGDAAPTPTEILLAALASCLTSGLGNTAAFRKITLESVESRVEGVIDLRGILGPSGEVRNSFGQIRVSFRVRGDAAPAEHRALVEQAMAWSAVAPTPEGSARPPSATSYRSTRSRRFACSTPTSTRRPAETPKRTSCSRSASSHRPPLLPPRAGRPANQAHRLRFAAHTFLIRRDRPPRHALMNTTTWRIAALMLAAPRRGTAGAGERAWTLA